MQMNMVGSLSSKRSHCGCLKLINYYGWESGLEPDVSGRCSLHTYRVFVGSQPQAIAIGGKAVVY